MADKKQQLIETAFSLFYQNGIHAVGINQILQQAGVAKKTLYSHFTGKDELVERVLHYRDERFVDWLTHRMTEAEPGRTALLAMFDALDDWFNNRAEELAQFNGCFFINSCSEYGDPDSSVHRHCAAHKARVRELIALHVSKLATVNNSELVDSLSLLKEGAIVTAQVQGDRAAALKAKRLAEQLLGQ